VGIGLAVAWISRYLLGMIAEANARNGLTLIIPFVCYLVASAVEASGVLSVLAAALFLGRSGDDEAGVADRLSGGAFWDTVELLITGVAFGLIGLELRDVLDTGVSVTGTVVPAVIICAILLVVRLAWMVATGPVVRRTRPARFAETSRNSREDVVLAWCGMRGLATIALALALPSATPQRGPLLLITFAIIVVTLVLPGLTLPWVVAKLGVRADTDAEEAAVWDLAKRAAKASLAKLRELDTTDDLPADVSDVLRQRQHGMVLMLAGEDGEPPSDQVRDPDYRAKLAQRAGQVKQIQTVYAEMLTAARHEVLIARTEPGTDPVAVDEVLRRLDLRSAHLI
jgi:CPA1 family monovalent cation:H+ antiporter